MKVKTLLALAATCTTDTAAEALLDTIREVFGKTRALGHLPEANPDFSMEGLPNDCSPFVRYELNHVLSNQFIIMIQPEIRDGKMGITVLTNHMRDGMGMQSRDWEIFKELEEHIEADSEMTVAQLAQAAKDEAIRQHAVLLESVGVATKAALRAAKASW